MSHSRPGGLTALALINIIFGFFAIIGGISGFFAPRMIAWSKAQMQGTLQAHQRQPQLTPEQVKQIEESLEQLEIAEAMMTDSPGRWMLVNSVNVLSSVLMFVSGIGLWRMRAFSGRVLGNLYVAVSISAQLLSHLLMKGVEGYEFSLLMLLMPLYGLLFLFLVNVTFAEDLD